DAGKAKESGNRRAESREDRLTHRCLEHDDGKQQLEAEPPGHRGPSDRAAVGREGERDGEDDDRAKERLQSAEHHRTSPRMSGGSARRSSPIVIARVTSSSAASSAALS